MLSVFSKNKYGNLHTYRSDFNKQERKELVRWNRVQSIYFFDLQ